MNYCILGAAKSGLAAVRLAYTLNKQTTPNDTIFVRELADDTNFQDTINEFNQLGIKYQFGPNSQDINIAATALNNIDTLIISPGVPNDAPFILEARKQNIPIISELEFGFQNIKNPIIAITGTNGKTTTTTLLNYIFNHANIPSVAAGNIGTPLSDISNDILNHKLTISSEVPIIVEVSSYQLEFIDKFRPKIAIILNVTPDHLRYHKTFENYLNTKINITKNQTDADYLILNSDDDSLNCKDIIAFKKQHNIKSNILQNSIQPIEWGYYLLDNKLINNTQHKSEEIMPLTKIKIPGLHNHYNSMAAATAASIWRIPNEDIRDSLQQFQGVEHRLEFVRTINNVDYVNDSKATNVNATWFALSSYNKPLIWIAGGRGDNNDYSLLDKLVIKNVVKIITIGEEKEKIYDRYNKTIPSFKTEDIYEAVELAFKIAEPDQIVLFSPACKSFDQFLNYEQRGKTFKQSVNCLMARYN